MNSNFQTTVHFALRTKSLDELYRALASIEGKCSSVRLSTLAESEYVMADVVIGCTSNHLSAVADAVSALSKHTSAPLRDTKKTTKLIETEKINENVVTPSPDKVPAVKVSGEWRKVHVGPKDGLFYYTKNARRSYIKKEDVQEKPYESVVCYAPDNKHTKLVTLPESKENLSPSDAKQSEHQQVIFPPTTKIEETKQ